MHVILFWRGFLWWEVTHGKVVKETLLILAQYLESKSNYTPWGGIFSLIVVSNEGNIMHGWFDLSFVVLTIKRYVRQCLRSVSNLSMVRGHRVQALWPMASPMNLFFRHCYSLFVQHMDLIIFCPLCGWNFSCLLCVVWVFQWWESTRWIVCTQLLVASEMLFDFEPRSPSMGFGE